MYKCDLCDKMYKSLRGMYQHYYKAHNLSCKIYYDNKNFDSAPELCYYIWLKDYNIEFVVLRLGCQAVRH